MALPKTKLLKWERDGTGRKEMAARTRRGWSAEAPSGRFIVWPIHLASAKTVWRAVYEYPEQMAPVSGSAFFTHMRKAGLRKVVCDDQPNRNAAMWACEKFFFERFPLIYLSAVADQEQEKP